MKWAARLMLALLVSPLALTIVVSFTPSRYLQIPRGELSLQWYREFFANPVWLEALGNSLTIAALTAALAVPAALCTALALVRERLGWKLWWEGAILLPLVLPGIALAVGMLAIVRLTPLWGCPWSLAGAHAVMAMPVAYLVLRGALERVDPNLEAAARGLGASPWQVARCITLPLVAPAIFAGTLFALVISLNEITLTLFLATRETETLPRVIWPQLRFAVTPVVAAASVILLVLTLPAIAAAGWWLRPRGGGR